MFAELSERLPEVKDTYESFLYDQIDKNQHGEWLSLLEGLNLQTESTSRQFINVGPLKIQKECAKLISEDRTQCRDCLLFFDKRLRHGHTHITSLVQYKWPKMGSKFICLLCMKERDDKIALAKHYLACHSLYDLETHLGISARILFLAVRPCVAVEEPIVA